MVVNNIELVVSAVGIRQYPDILMPEVAFVGRSNVGKSSLINKMAGRKKLARVSATPGKTATINFYNVEDTLYFVDLPGYGYAKVSKSEKKRWGEMIEEYLMAHHNLQLVIQLVDIRHKPSEDDKIMLNWIRRCGYPVCIAATKADKLSKNQQDAAVEVIKSELKLTSKDIFVKFSSETGDGREELWQAIEGSIISDI